ncbi:MAG: outer membrane beta-barrel protein, partial [Gammaproteobacteria bacterium]
GPGRGYPVFNVVEQGERIEILKKKTNWYKVRTADEKTGWTRAVQLAHTLKPTGAPADLPEVGHGDYLTSHWRMGFTTGQLEDANTISITAGYRPVSWAGIEVEGGKIFDESVTSDYYGVNLLVEPLPDSIITPYVTVGAGRFSFNNRQKVVVEDTGSADYGSVGAGVGYYVVRNFVIRGEYRGYSVSTDGDRVWLNAWTIGLNAFF